MAVTHSKSSRLYFNTHTLSGKIKGFQANYQRKMSEVTALLDGGQKNIPGLMEGGISLSGHFEQDATNLSIFEILNNTRNVDNGALVTALPNGTALGQSAFITQADPSSFEVEAQVDDAVSLKYEAESDNGNDWGIVLHTDSAVTATANDTSVDNAAATTGGSVASLHVAAASGTTPSTTIKVQHSTDNSVWVDLITFTAATTITKEFKTSSGTVNRYVRCSYAISGTTPSFTFILAFARR